MMIKVGMFHMILIRSAKLLINENDIPYIDNLKGKTLEDFKDLKTHLQNSVTVLETEIVEKAQEALDLDCKLWFRVRRFFKRLSS